MAVRHRVFTNAGETFEGGDTTKCPGEANCDDWAQPFDGSGQWTGDSGQFYAEKVEAICHGCPKFDTKPSADSPDADIDPEEIEDLVDDIADIAFLENGGQQTDWNEYPFEYYRLFCWLRAAEREIEESRKIRLDGLVRSFSK